MESLSIGGGKSGRDSYEVNHQKEDDNWNFQQLSWSIFDENMHVFPMFS